VLNNNDWLLHFNPRTEKARIDLEFLVARYRQIEVPVFVSSKATRKWNEVSFAHQGDVCIVGWASIGETDRDRCLIELVVYFGKASYVIGESLAVEG
jgi:hypothetical protein